MLVLTIGSLLFILGYNTISGSNPRFQINSKLSACDLSTTCKNGNPNISYVCGVRTEGQRFHLQYFESMCEVLKHECEGQSLLDEEFMKIEFCNEAPSKPYNNYENKKTACVEFDCSYPADAKPVCGVRPEGDGFTIKLFEDKCKLAKFNCEERTNFDVTYLYICTGVEQTSHPPQANKINNNLLLSFLNGSYEDVLKEKNKELHSYNTTIDNFKAIYRRSENGDNEEFVKTNIMAEDKKNSELYLGNNEAATKLKKAAFVVHASSIDPNFHKNVNESINKFFESTHTFAYRTTLDELDLQQLNTDTRRRLVKLFSPINVFKPFKVKPDVVLEDENHTATLASCYHRCPQKCPDTYAPVCGNPGLKAREPSLMFRNHCFMDVAQCKMKRENKGPTAETSAYIEAQFFFCLGDEMLQLYRFFPVLKTLQQMGRIRKGQYHHKIRNMKLFSDDMIKNFRIQG